jgi:lysophospholipase L1-like esterase
MIYPLRPKLVVLYCGENDIANDVHGAEEPLADFRTLVATLRQEMPGVGIVFISMKPSPLRWDYWPKFQASNKMIEDYIRQQEKMWYLDVGQAMLAPSGRPEPSIFLRDSLHMNAKGYALWTQLLKPQIEDIYKTVQE